MTRIPLIFDYQTQQSSVEVMATDDWSCNRYPFYERDHSLYEPPPKQIALSSMKETTPKLDEPNPRVSDHPFLLVCDQENPWEEAKSGEVPQPTFLDTFSERRHSKEVSYATMIFVIDHSIPKLSHKNIVQESIICHQ